MLDEMDKLQKMHSTIKNEIKLIPRSNKNVLQNQFRFLYYNSRMKSLSKHHIRQKNALNKIDVFNECLSELRSKHPDFVPEVRGVFKKEVNKHAGKR